MSNKYESENEPMEPMEPFENGDKLKKETLEEAEYNRVDVSRIFEILSTIALSVINFIGTAVRTLVFGDSSPINIGNKNNEKVAKEKAKEQIKQNKKEWQKEKEQPEREFMHEGMDIDEVQKSKVKEKENGYTSEGIEQKEKFVRDLLDSAGSKKIVKHMGLQLENDNLMCNGIAIPLDSTMKKMPKNVAKALNTIKETEYFDKYPHSQKDINNCLYNDIKAAIICAKLQNNKNPENKIDTVLEINNGLLHNISIKKDENEKCYLYVDNEKKEIDLKKVSERDIEKLADDFTEKVCDSIMNTRFLESDNQVLQFKKNTNGTINMVLMNDNKVNSLGHFRVKETKDLEKINEALEKNGWNNKIDSKVVAYAVGKFNNPSITQTKECKFNEYFNKYEKAFENIVGKEMSIANEEGIKKYTIDNDLASAFKSFPVDITSFVTSELSKSIDDLEKEDVIPINDNEHNEEHTKESKIENSVTHSENVIAKEESEIESDDIQKEEVIDNNDISNNQENDNKDKVDYSEQHNVMDDIPYDFEEDYSQNNTDEKNTESQEELDDEGPFPLTQELIEAMARDMCSLSDEIDYSDYDPDKITAVDGNGNPVHVVGREDKEEYDRYDDDDIEL